MVPELADPMLEVHDHLVTGAILLQGLSSLVGLLLVIAASVYALRGGHAAVGPRVLNASERRRWVLLFTATTLFFCAAFAILDRVYGNPYHRWLGVLNVAVALLRALVVAALLVSALLQRSLRAKRLTPQVKAA
jgi:hypothetical protein